MSALPRHHAFVAYGSLRHIKELASYMAKQLQMEVAHNPDVHIREFDSLGVDDARALARLSNLSSTSTQKLFVLGARALTREAQNALLKVIEEPTPGTTFALLVPTGALIATLKSRLIEIRPMFQKEDTTLAETFLGASGLQRSKLISKIVEQKEKHVARELLDGIEGILHLEVARRDVREALREVSLMREYLMGPSPSVKMILEHIALMVPHIKQ